MTPDYPNPYKANYGLAILLIAYIHSFIDRQILNVLVEPIKRDLAISDFQISLLQGMAFMTFYILMSIPLGRLADKTNRKKIIVAGVFVWSLMTILCGLTKTYYMFFAARSGIGIGQAALSPAAYSMLGDYFPPKKLARAIGIFTMGMTIGAGTAYLIGGSILHVITTFDTISLPFIGTLQPWQMTFVIAGLPGLIIGLMVMTIMEPPRRGVFTVTQKSETEGWRGVFAFIGKHRRNYLPIIVAISLLAVLSYGTLNWYPTFLIRTYDISIHDAGIYFGFIYLVFGTAGALGGPLFSEYLMKRNYTDANPRTIMLVALALTFPSILGPLMPNTILALMVAAPIVFFLNAYFAVSIAALQLITPNEMRGLLIAIILFITNLAGLGVGSSLVAFFTDFIYGNPQHLRYSLVTVTVLTCPAAAYIVHSGLENYRSALKQIP